MLSHFKCTLTMHCALQKKKEKKRKQNSSLGPVNCLSNGVKIVITVNIYYQNICTRICLFVFLRSFSFYYHTNWEFSEFIWGHKGKQHCIHNLQKHAQNFMMWWKCFGIQNRLRISVCTENETHKCHDRWIEIVFMLCKHTHFQEKWVSFYK